MRAGLPKESDVLRATLAESEIRRVIGVPGEGNLVLNGVATLDAAEDRCLHYINQDLSAETRAVLAGRQGCIFIAPMGSSLAGLSSSSRVLEVPQPRTAIAKVLAFIRAEGRLQPWLTSRRIGPTAVISPLAVLEGNVHIADGVAIEAFCTVGPDAAIGRDTIVRAGARIGERVTIGERSLIGRNSVIGEEGYGYVRDDNGNKMRIPHLGGILIGSHVEIDSLTVIQYGTIGPTIVEDHAKVGSSNFVGHNVRIGRGASLTAGNVLGGSSVVGEDVWIGMNASVRNGRRVGAHSLVGMDASIQDDLADRTVARARPADVAQRSPDDDEQAIGFTARPRRESK
jgi:UDP-3-O-[3-hydroxymyristoyl] glucosamine N-acyltransferase